MHWKFNAMIVVAMCLGAGPQRANAPGVTRPSETDRSQPNRQEIALADSGGFLSESLRDTLAIVGALGAVITALGLCVALWQIRRTRSAAEASTEAAQRAYNESRGSYSRHVMTNMERLLSEAEQHVENEKWELAETRLRDIFEHMLQLPDTDPPWKEFADRVEGMRGSFERVRKGEIELKKGLRDKWRNLVSQLRATVIGHTGPFRAREGGKNS